MPPNSRQPNQPHPKRTSSSPRLSSDSRKTSSNRSSQSGQTRTARPAPKPKEPSTPKPQPAIPEIPAQLDYVLIAEITSPFGLRGAVKATMLTDFPERFDHLEEVFLAPPGAPLDAQRVRYEVLSARIQNDRQVVLRLVGIGKTEQAEELRGYSVAVPVSDVVPLPEGEYYIFQIIGLDVYTVKDEYVGKVVNVESRTANDIYVVRGPMSSRDVLIPAIKDVIKSIDLDKGRITVELLDGLLEL